MDRLKMVAQRYVVQECDATEVEQRVEGRSIKKNYPVQIISLCRSGFFTESLLSAKAFAALIK